MNRLTMTKAIAELKGLFTDRKKTRETLNIPPLKMFQSDNLNHDGSLWNQVFRDDLSHGVVPYKSPNKNLPTAGISTSSFEHLTTVQGMD